MGTIRVLSWSKPDLSGMAPDRNLLKGVAAVTFDVGGTLIECWPSVGQIYADVAAESGFPGLDPTVLNHRFAAAWKSLSGFRHTRSQWAALVDETFGPLLPVAPSATFFDVLYERFTRREAWHVFADVFPLLHELKLKQVKLAVISNWDHRLRPLLGELGLASFFDTLVVSCDYLEPKPSASLFGAAAAALNAHPGAILHVGDDPVMDVEGAVRAGFKALLLNRKSHHCPAGTICSLRELAT